MIRCAGVSIVGLDVGLGSASRVDLALYAFGWLAGWFLLWRPRPLPAAVPGAPRRPVAVVIPVRDEEDALPHLIVPLVEQLVTGDELVVIDDHSTDGTAALASSLGARVMTPPPLPAGWVGKPHACWHGASNTRAPTLLFLDADVRPAPDLLDRLAIALGDDPGSVVSVQPWHTTGRPYEQTSLLCNVTALMGAGAFTALGSNITTRVAFGPVVAIERETYDHAGGHADPVTRGMHTEDIGLARAVGRAQLYTGRPDTRFRMYPNGVRETVEGWTRSIATGARFTPGWIALLVLAWIWSLAGGWLSMPIVYPLSAIQFWVLGRRAGSMHLVTALVYPLAVVVFVLVFLRSLFTVLAGRDVPWKRRRVSARSGG